MGEGDNDKLKT